MIFQHPSIAIFYNNPMEYYKTYCSSHPYETITNFCADSQCLVGLCATCICEHTQQHLKRGSPPCYENVKNTFTKYNERMREQVTKIEQDKEWLGTVCQKIEEKRNKVRVVLAKARDDCVALVHKHFDELEQNIESQINNESKKNSLHSGYRLETLNTLLQKEISSLLLYSKDLSSNKFLDTVQQVEQEVFPNSNDFHFRVSKELKENEVYTANAIYNQQFLADLAFALKRLVKLEFHIPRVECVEDIRREDYMKRSNSMKKGSASMMVSPNSKQFTDFSKVRNVSAISSPCKQSMSIVMPTPPIQQILNSNAFRNQSESGLSKASKLTSALKSIRETKRENSQFEQSKSLASSSVSYDKENDCLAHSTYYDSGSNFFK